MYIYLLVISLLCLNTDTSWTPECAHEDDVDYIRTGTFFRQTVWKKTSKVSILTHMKLYSSAGSLYNISNMYLFSKINLATIHAFQINYAASKYTTHCQLCRKLNHILFVLRDKAYLTVVNLRKVYANLRSLTYEQTKYIYFMSIRVK